MRIPFPVQSLSPKTKVVSMVDAKDEITSSDHRMGNAYFWWGMGLIFKNYPLVICNIANEIVSFPIKHGDFSVCDAKLPEGKNTVVQWILLISW